VTNGDEVKRLFRVKLARPVFEIAIVDVEAADHDEARRLAKRQAPTLPNEAWVGSFDPMKYGHDVQDLTDSRLVDEGEIGPEALVMTPEPDEDVHYVLLRGDLFSGEGEVLFQPWMIGEGKLVITDLVNDWIDALEEIRETDIDELLDGTFGGDDARADTQSAPSIAIDQGGATDPDPSLQRNESPSPSDRSDTVISLSSRRSKRRRPRISGDEE
jgi:hypothetical protein